MQVPGCPCVLGYPEVCALAEAKAAAAGGVEEVQLSLMQKGKALVGALQPAYWQALIVVSLLYFARFDASFITLRARTVRSPSITPSYSCSACLIGSAAHIRLAV